MNATDFGRTRPPGHSFYYSYPRLDPEEAIDIVETLVNTFKGEPSNEDNFAQSIGHSTSNSGAYKGKMADLRKYGLIESRGVKATSLARKLANPKDKEEEIEAKFRALDNIDLLKDLYEELDGQEPQGNLFIILSELTGVEREEAKEVADEISNLYNKMLRYDKKRQNNVASATKSQPESSSEPSGEAPDDGLFIKIKDDEISLSEANNANIDLAIQFLKQRKESDEN